MSCEYNKSVIVWHARLGGGHCVNMMAGGEKGFFKLCTPDQHTISIRIIITINFDKVCKTFNDCLGIYTATILCLFFTPNVQNMNMFLIRI